ncbi:MAG: RNA polymerase sigma factor [Burkholderiaceae bacterium]
MQALIQELIDHYADLRRYLLHELRDADQAADIAQSSFERVYARAFGVGANDGKSQGGAFIGSIRALLFRVARNLCIDEARHRKIAQNWARTQADAWVSHAAPSCEQLLAQHRVLTRVIATLEALPPRRRQVFLLARAYGHSHAEIAQRLGITEMAVAKHLVRAVLDCSSVLKELKDQLLDDPHVPGLHEDFRAMQAEDRC